LGFQAAAGSRCVYHPSRLFLPFLENQMKRKAEAPMSHSIRVPMTKPIYIFGLLIILLLSASRGNAQEFTLTTSAANIISSKVSINMPGLNGNPLAIIVATPLGRTATLNPHPVGAWYYSGKWNIFNTDHAVMVPGLNYKIQYYPTPGPNQFLHVISRQNLGAEGSVIDHPALNNNPNAQFQILQNHAPDNRAGHLNASEAAAVYNPGTGKWYIASVNGRPLNQNSAYNIVILSSSPVSSIETGRPPPSLSVNTTPSVVPSLTPAAAAHSSTTPVPTSPGSPGTPCTNDMAANTPGKWARQRPDDLAIADKSFPKEQFKAVLAKAQKVIDLLVAANPQPVGIQAVAKRNIRGESFTPGGPLKFAVEGHYGAFFCVPNTAAYGAAVRGTVIPGGESGSAINIYFNHFGWAIEDIHGEGAFLSEDGMPLFYSPKQLGDFKGMTLLEPTMINGGRQQAVVITSSGRLPYLPVSREQFIQSRISYYRNFYRKLERPAFEPTIAQLESLLATLSPAQRQIQAVITDPLAPSEKLFTTEARHGRPVVKLDRDFVDTKLPRAAIRFLTVYWSWDEKNAAVSEMMKQFKTNFDFEALKQMIGR
jgi:hypothetical protein